MENTCLRLVHLRQGGSLPYYHTRDWLLFLHHVQVLEGKNGKRSEGGKANPSPQAFRESTWKINEMTDAQISTPQSSLMN